jgi:protein-S-isoprenylcysteine O-methyltransferase Ste14
VIVGFGLYQRSQSIVLFSLVWLLLAHLFVVLYEQPTLRRKFGEIYDVYCKDVPRGFRDGPDLRQQRRGRLRRA